MEMMEIILLIAGGVIFVLSFFIPDGKGRKDRSDGLAEQEVKNLVSQELEAVRNHVDDVVEEAVTYSMEKTERSLERLSNEKIMAVNEYSETVLKEIHKNHEEAMFLYDMLNNKHTHLKDTIAELNGAVKAAEDMLAAVSRAGSEPAAAGTGAAAEEVLSSAEPEAVFLSMSAMQEETEHLQEVTADILSDSGEGVNNNERILKLYREGKSAIDIARELGLGVGEVKLVIGLFQNQ